jgi:hypothetical protein
MVWAAVAKFCSISRMKVSAAFSRASCLRLGRICGISPRSRSPRDALAPDADETSQSQQQKFPVTDVFNYVEVADGRVWRRPEGVVCFAGDLPEQEQKVVWATHFMRRLPTCSAGMPLAPPGSRSRLGTSWPTTTARFSRICNASSRSVWVPPPMRSTAATSLCFPTRAS